jgi:hypothetical protein
MLAPSSTSSFGWKSAIKRTVSAPIAPTIMKAARQLRSWPRKVATGVPTSVAIVSPSMTWPTARARRWAGTIEAATSAATPK